MLQEKRNFSRVTKLADEHGTAVILKNHVPRYPVIDFSRAEKEKAVSTEDVTAISERLLKQNMETYEILPFHASFFVFRDGVENPLDMQNIKLAAGDIIFFDWGNDGTKVFILTGRFFLCII